MYCGDYILGIGIIHFSPFFPRSDKSKSIKTMVICVFILSEWGFYTANFLFYLMLTFCFMFCCRLFMWKISLWQEEYLKYRHWNKHCDFIHCMSVFICIWLMLSYMAFVQLLHVLIASAHDSFWECVYGYN